eukprot:776785-Alexandrium_andersonii.AAC.1
MAKRSSEFHSRATVAFDFRTSRVRLRDLSKRDSSPAPPSPASAHRLCRVSRIVRADSGGRVKIDYGASTRTVPAPE